MNLADRLGEIKSVLSRLEDADARMGTISSEDRDFHVRYQITPERQRLAELLDGDLPPSIAGPLREYLEDGKEPIWRVRHALERWQGDQNLRSRQPSESRASTRDRIVWMLVAYLFLAGVMGALVPALTKQSPPFERIGSMFIAFLVAGVFLIDFLRAARGDGR